MSSIRVYGLTAVVALLVVAACFTIYGINHSRAYAAEQFRQLSSDDAEAAVLEIIQRDGVDAAWDFLMSTYIVDGAIRLGTADVHSLAHTVGAGFYHADGIAGLNKCDDTFTGGCYHGVVAEFILTEGVDQSKWIAALCTEQSDPVSCAHGAGHGIHESSVGSVSRALAHCANFPDAIAPDCAEGVLMDASWGWDNAGLELKPWRACDTVPDDYKVPCASAIGNYFSEYRNENGVRKYSPYEVAQVCTTSPEHDMSAICFVRIEQSVARRAAGGEGNIQDLCSYLPSARQVECVQRATEFASRSVQ